MQQRDYAACETLKLYKPMIRMCRREADTVYKLELDNSPTLLIPLLDDCYAHHAYVIRLATLFWRRLEVAETRFVISNLLRCV